MCTHMRMKHTFSFSQACAVTHLFHTGTAQLFQKLAVDNHIRSKPVTAEETLRDEPHLGVGLHRRPQRRRSEQSFLRALNVPQLLLLFLGRVFLHTVEEGSENRCCAPLLNIQTTVQRQYIYCIIRLSSEFFTTTVSER